MNNFSPQKQNIYKRKSRSSDEFIIEKVKKTYSLCLENLPFFDKNNESEIQFFICKILNFLKHFSIFNNISLNSMKEFKNKYIILIQTGTYLLNKNSIENKCKLDFFHNNVDFYEHSCWIKKILLFVEQLKYLFKNSLIDIICFSDENDFEKINTNFDLTKFYKFIANKSLNSKNNCLNLNTLLSAFYNFLDLNSNDNSFDNFLIIFPILNLNNISYDSCSLRDVFKIFSDQYLSALFAPIIIYNDAVSNSNEIFYNENLQEFLLPFCETEKNQFQNILNNLNNYETECNSIFLNISNLFNENITIINNIQQNSFNKILNEYIQKAEIINSNLINIQSLLYHEYLESQKNILRFSIFKEKVSLIIKTNLLENIKLQVRNLNYEYIENKDFKEKLKKNFTQNLNEIKFNLENFKNKFETKSKFIHKTL
jgi:hypothetical protein